MPGSLYPEFDEAAQLVRYSLGIFIGYDRAISEGRACLAGLLMRNPRGSTDAITLRLVIGSGRSQARFCGLREVFAAGGAGDDGSGQLSESSRAGMIGKKL